MAAAAPAHGTRRPAALRRWARAGGATALLAAALACVPDRPAETPVYDLGENLAYASVTRETAAILLGSAADEAHLGVGWSHRETEGPTGRAFRWGLEPASEITFTVIEPRAVTLRLEGRPRRGPADRPRAVTVEVNDKPAGRLDLGPDPREYALELGADLLRRGVNRLRLAYELGDPTGLPPAEIRPIAVAWYRLAFAGLVTPDGEPRLDARQGALFVPHGSRVDFYLRAPSAASLRSPGRRYVGGPGRLTVDLASDGGGEQRLADLAKEGELDVALEAAADGAIRLSLAAVPAAAASGGGIALEAPAVWARAAAAPEVPAPARAGTGGTRPNVIIYLVDTLRADRLGCYGHSRDVSPRIDGFAAGATLFENARAQAPWTLPAIASVMTGLWPPTHGALDGSLRLGPDVVTLAEVLRDAGYQTAAMVTNGFATDAYGMDQGFDELTLISTSGRKSALVHAAAVDWLGRRDPQRPFFLYLHTIDPHHPYLPAEEHRQKFAADADEVFRQIVANPSKQQWEPTESNVAQLLALYDAEVAENDASFGETLDALAAAEVYDDALIVFLSDHGEEFHEHGSWTHASNLFPEALNVPLIVKLPGQREGRRVAELAQQIDLMPTLLAYLGIAAPPTEGRLLPAILGPPGPAPLAVFSHTQRKNQTTASVIEGDWKLIRRADDKGITSRLYNWRDDPRELTDLAARYPVLTGLLTVALQRRIADSRPPQAVEAAPDGAVLDNLRALGYVD